MLLRLTLLSLALPGCLAPDVLDAGDPSALDDFDAEEGALWSDLADAGWEHFPGQYNVLLDADAADAPALRGALLGRVRDAELVSELDTIPVFTARMSFAEALALAGDPAVLAVEPDWLAFAVRDTDDVEALARPVAASCASSTVQAAPSGVTALGTNAAGRTGAGVNVAVLDTGIDTTHSDLSVAGLVDETGSRGGGIDDNGHGTHVSGTIAALDNTLGVIGVAPDADLYGVKVLDRRGSGSYSGIAAGIDWAVAHGMDVLNMSLGGSADSATLHTAITAAYDADVVTVVAAGNSGVSATLSYPAAYDGEVLTISAWSVSSSSFPSWSNYGIPPVDVAAPGVGVCSTARGGSYQTMDGTSMATPHVVGAVALYLEGHPTATFAQVEAAIEGGVTALADTARHREDLARVTGL